MSTHHHAPKPLPLDLSDDDVDRLVDAARFLGYVGDDAEDGDGVVGRILLPSSDIPIRFYSGEAALLDTASAFHVPGRRCQRVHLRDADGRDCGVVVILMSRSGLSKVLRWMRRSSYSMSVASPRRDAAQAA